MQSYLIKNTSLITREYYDCSFKEDTINNGLELCWGISKYGYKETNKK